MATVSQPYPPEKTYHFWMGKDDKVHECPTERGIHHHLKGATLSLIGTTPTRGVENDTPRLVLVATSTEGMEVKMFLTPQVWQSLVDNAPRILDAVTPKTE